MTKILRLAIALTLLASSGIATADDTATVKIYGEKCTMCHGEDGRGKTELGKQLKVGDWTDGKTLKSMSDAEILKMLQNGKQRMPAYATLGAAALKAMVAYVRTLEK